MNNITTPEKLLEFLISNKINYSKRIDGNLKTTDEVLESKCGSCWEIVELERLFFKQFNPLLIFKTFMIVNINDKLKPTHTFILYYKNNNKYWFEYAYRWKEGIYTNNNILESVIDTFNKASVNNRNLDPINTKVYEYDIIYKYGINESGYNIKKKIIENGLLINSF